MIPPLSFFLCTELLKQIFFKVFLFPPQPPQHAAYHLFSYAVRLAGPNACPQPQISKNENSPPFRPPFLLSWRRLGLISFFKSLSFSAPPLRSLTSAGDAPRCYQDSRIFLLDTPLPREFRHAEPLSFSLQAGPL